MDNKGKSIIVFGLATTIVLVVFSTVLVFALPKLNSVNAEVDPSNGNAQVVIPAHAVEVSHGVFDLGSSVVDGKEVQGFAFIDYRKEFHHRPGHDKGGSNGGGGDGDGTSSCYEFLAKGAKWRTVENYIVDPSNSAGLNDAEIRNTLANSIAQWEDAADGSVDGVQGADILGDEVSGIVDGADTINPDNKNEVLFADIANDGAIGVTIVWGIFRGPPHQRELVEWDQVYDDADFEWSSTGEPGKMDFWNIAQHELGHSIGLGHPLNDCTEETMYAFATEGETKKRSLNAGDIAGTDELY